MKIKGATLRGLVKDLPKSLGLKKKTPQTEKLRDAFWGHFAHAFYEEAHKAFITKSKGGTDESGMKWKPLSEKTKRNRLSQTKGGLGKLLSKRNRKTNPERKGKKYKTSAFARLAAVMGEKDAKKMVSSGNVPILIRSGRLVESIKPAKMSGNRYYKKKDQIYELGDGRVKLGSEVPYADRQNIDRPLFGNEAVFIERAMEKATQALSKQLGQL
tara:strand:+ start:16416 stop:17057 length:642 start_codon:yes stop_codon:yes gene_type:complete